MNASARRQALLWFVPVAFLLHNIEQSVKIRESMELARTGMPRFLRIIIPPVSADAYIVALGIATVLAFAVALWGKIDRDRAWGIYALVALQMALFLNVIAHVIASLVLKRYTAGLATALALILPLSVVLFWFVLRERWMPRWAFLLIIPAGAFLHVPLFFGILFFSGHIARWLGGAG
jgi:Protein of unknown function with HXXEE motif